MAGQFDIDVIVLAGDRGPGDPLARSAGVSGKALVPVAGQPMMTRVLKAVAEWPRLNRLILVAPPTTAYREAASAAGFDAGSGLVWLAPAQTLSGSVQAALSASQAPLRLLLTADHALMNRHWLDRLAEEGARPGVSGLSVGLTDWHGVMRRFPGSRRTCYRFSDRSICGTNLFIVHDDSAMLLLDAWQRVEQERKKPWRIVGLLGWRNLLAYLAGRLSLEEAFAALSARLGVAVRPFLIDDPLTAVDVDSSADLLMVESVLVEDPPAPC